MLTIGIVLYKNVEYLEKCISSILAQRYVDFELVLRDCDVENSASDFIKQKFKDKRIKYLPNSKNSFHSGGHNENVKSARGEYYICGSYDMYYPSDFLTKVAAEIEKNPKEIIAPKMLRWDFAEDKLSNVIDSTGIVAKCYHKFADRGQGEVDTGRYESGRVFGASGACFVIPREVWEEVGGFDKNIFYKNDVDLAYRLNWLGYQTRYCDDIVVYHDRQVSEVKEKSLKQKESSQLGQEILVAKNWSDEYSLRVRFFTKMYMWMRKIMFPKVQLPQNIKKSERKISPQEMEKLFK